MSVVARRRLVAAAVLVGLVAAVVLVLRGGGPPRDTTAALVPADALTYVHVSTKPGRDADAELAHTLGRLPGLRRAYAAGLRRIGGGAFTFGRDIRPWLGDEAALALLPRPGASTADALVLAAVRDRDVARVFLSRAGAGAAGPRPYRGVDVLALGAQSAAIAGDVLLLGPEARVRQAIDLQQGRGGRALTTVPAFAGSVIPEAEDRVVELYAPAAGVRGVLAPRLGALGAALAPTGLRALRAEAEPVDAGVRVRARLLRRGGAATFAPRLVDAAPRSAAGVLGLASADPLVARLLVAAPGLAAQATAAGVDLERDLLAPVRGREVAVWVTPGTPVPGFAVAARTAQPARAREALGRLQGPLAAALAPSDAQQAGSVPLFEQREVAGVQAFGLAVAPGIDLLYAVFGDELVIATSEGALAAVRRGAPRGAGLLGRAQGPGGVEIPATGAEAVGFFLPGQLLALGDQIGIGAGPAVQAVREDLARIRAISAAARREGTDSTAELLFQIP